MDGSRSFITSNSSFTCLINPIFLPPSCVNATSSFLINKKTSSLIRDEVIRGSTLSKYNLCISLKTRNVCKTYRNTVISSGQLAEALQFSSFQSCFQPMAASLWEIPKTYSFRSLPFSHLMLVYAQNLFLSIVLYPFLNKN